MKRKTALVLSAGGMFGAYQAGAYRTIAEIAPPEIVTGASVGALNGWAIAGGASPEELIDEWRHPSAGEALQLFPNAGWRKGWFDPVPLRHRAETLYRVHRPQLPYGLVITELPTLRMKLIGGNDVRPEHLHATCSIPLFLPPVKIGRWYYLDGGIFEKLPIWAAVEMGATRIIAIDSLPRVGPWWLRIGIEIAYAFKRRRRYAPEIEITLISPSEPLGDVYDAVHWRRENVDRWIELGARDAAQALSQVGSAVVLPAMRDKR